MDIFIDAFNQALKFFFEFSGNYGLAIILLTIALRLVLWPLTISQVTSAKKMQELQPEMERLRKKYKNDPNKLNQEMVKMWRENKINPASGCLPLLVQLPFLWAFYKVLLDNPAFKGASFLWISNLAVADKTLILPILAGATTFWQSWMTTPKDGSQQMQQKMMLYMMPPFIVWITYTLPAGVALYWVVGNLFTILQQYIVPSGLKRKASGEGKSSNA